MVPKLLPQLLQDRGSCTVSPKIGEADDADDGGLKRSSCSTA
jgi:hypothetical protein